MGGGDLNMKKSWHPLTLANQRRVAEEKRKAAEEEQRAVRLQKELREERQREEMERLNATVTKKKINKLEWMYNAPSTGAPQTSEDLEEYLLGKKDATQLANQKSIESDVVSRPEDKWKKGLFAFSNRNANSDKDAAAKALEDPLAEIQRREQAAMMRVMSSNHSHAQKNTEKRKSREKGERKSDSEHKHRHRHRRNHHHSDERSSKSTHKHSDSQGRQSRDRSKRDKDKDSSSSKRHRRRRSQSPSSRVSERSHSPLSRR
ncbi:RNA-splicing factor [Coemansia sp. RSA 1365]|nr:RNA-splicing factor [Coemansia sp. RSA 1365]